MFVFSLSNLYEYLKYLQIKVCRNHLLKKNNKVFEPLISIHFAFNTEYIQTSGNDSFLILIFNVFIFYVA